MKCLNETVSQLIDGVRVVQEDQSNMALIIDKLATKVRITHWINIFFLTLPNEFGVTNCCNIYIYY